MSRLNIGGIVLDKTAKVVAYRHFIDEYLLKAKLTKDKYEYWSKLGYKYSTIYKMITECNAQYQKEIEIALTGFYTKENILNGYHGLLTRTEGTDNRIYLSTLDSIAKITGMTKDNTDITINIPKLQVEYLTTPVLPTFFDSSSVA